MKKIIQVTFFSLACLICFTSHAQDPAQILKTSKEYISKAQNSYENKNFSDAFSYYNYAIWVLKDKEKEDEKLTQLHIDVLLQLSDLHFELEQFDEAKSNLVEAKSIAITFYDKNNPSLAAIYKKIADQYLASQEVSTALEYYEQAYKIYHKNDRYYKKEIAGIFYKKAYILNHYKKEMDEALKECKKALKVSGGDNSIVSGEIYNECGLIEFVRGNFEESYSYFLHALTIKEKQLGHNNKEVGKIYEEFGAVNWELEHYDTAMYFYEQAKSIYKSVYPNVSAHIEAINYHNTGLVYIELDDTLNKSETMRNDLDINKVTLDKKNENLAKTYVRIGHTYLHMKKYTEAATSMEKSISIYQELYPDELHKDLANLYDLIGTTYSNSNAPEKAKLAFQKCFDIRESMLGADDPLTLDAQSKMNSIAPVRR